MRLLATKPLKLRPKILNLKPGTHIVSNTFDMDKWEPDETAEATGSQSYGKAHLWIVAAKVAGTWQLSQGELTLKQYFQTISGTLKSGSNVIDITNGRLEGSQITFTAGNSQYAGRVSGNVMTGNVSSGGSWQATRASN